MSTLLVGLACIATIVILGAIIVVIEGRQAREQSSGKEGKPLTHQTGPPEE